jgi:hypothetical protein
MQGWGVGSAVVCLIALCFLAKFLESHERRAHHGRAVRALLAATTTISIYDISIASKYRKSAVACLLLMKVANEGYSGLALFHYQEDREGQREGEGEEREGSKIR